MKILKHALLLIAGLCITTAATAAPKMAKAYLYGFAASFNDSTVYFTNIQTVDSAWYASGTGFLMSRDNYAYQLRDELAKKGFQNPTAIVCYEKKLKKAEKKYKKLLQRYQNPKKGGHYVVRFLSKDDFKFDAITPYEVEHPEAYKEEKSKKQTKGGQRPDGPRPGNGGPGNGGMGGPGGPGGGMPMGGGQGGPM